MSLLDSIVGQVAGSLSAGGNTAHPGLLEAITGLIGQQQGGANGLQALITAFEQKGLGNLAASWVGTGSNLPVTADQITTVLGSDKVKAIAQSLGLSPDVASTGLATLLPQVIDKLTPAGNMPAHSALSEGLSLLRGLSTPR